MAVAFNANTDRLLRTTDLLNYNNAYTVMGWAQLRVDVNAQVSFFTLNDNTVDNVDMIRTNADGVTLETRVVVAAALTITTGNALTVGQWYHLAMVRENATSFKIYQDAVAAPTNTRDVSGRSTAATRFECGGFRSLNQFALDGRLAYMKAWSAALTVDEIANEMLMVRPLRAVNLYGWWPLLPGTGERVRDYSGNARDWTEGGTLSDEDPPPVSWGIKSNKRIFTGGTIFTQSISATEGNSFTLIKSAGKVIAVSNTPTFTKTALVNKPLLFTASDTATVKKQVGKSVSALNGSTITFANTTTKNISAIVNDVVTKTALVNKTITSTATNAVSFVRQVGKRISVAVSNAVSIAAQLIPGSGTTFTQTISATASTVTSFVRTTSKFISNISTQTVTDTKQLSKTITLPVTTSVIITKLRTVLKIITVSSTSAVVRSSVISKNITATSSYITTLSITVTKIVRITIPSQVTILKGLSQIIIATVTSTVDITVEVVIGIVQTFYRNTRSIALHIKNTLGLSTNQSANLEISPRQPDDDDVLSLRQPDDDVSEL